ncbi:MAG: FitA-like ribbon-helix-helix domain-containing protein [Actinomycetota bacterium]
MKSLHVRGIPDDVYVALKRMAGREGRSLSSQVVAILRKALLERRSEDRAATLRRVDARVKARRKAVGEMRRPAAGLIREDRDH